ncbi:MAG: HlyD family secretion protein [Myxococcales bacterium]|nr:HlyD family secretion protein [Myxococcales bacterium]
MKRVTQKTEQPPLVRPEIADFPALRQVRSARVARRVAQWMALMFLLFGFALALLPWQQSASGMGRVIAYTPLERQQTISAPLEGRIVRWWVQEGSRVNTGDRLLEITDNDPMILDRLIAEANAIRDKLERSKERAMTVDERIGSLTESRSLGVNAAESRVQMAVDRQRAAEQTLSAARAADVAAQLNLERQSRLLDEGLASKRAVELAQMEGAQRSTDVDKALAALSAARNELQALRSEQRKVGTDIGAAIESARADRAKAQEDVHHAEAELNRIEVRLSRQRSQVLHAPRPGTVLRLHVGEGAEMVKAGDPLMVLVPDTVQRAVELWVDGNDIPLVSAGRHVRLQFEGWPAIQFTGWPSVAVGTFGATVAFVDAADNGRGDFRIVVVPDEADEPWPEGRFLRQGVRARGWVLLGQVRLGFELWRIFNGFPPMILPEADAPAKKDNNDGKPVDDGSKGGKDEG